MFKRIVGTLVVALGLVACGGEDDGAGVQGSGAAIQAAPTSGAPNTLSPAAGKSEFLGRWSVTGSSVSTRDGGNLPESSIAESVTGMVTIAEGVDSDIVIDAESFVLPAMVNGTSATLERGYEYDVPTELGPMHFKVTHGQATLNGTVIQVTLTQSYSAIVNGSVYTGTQVNQWTLTKVSK